MSEKILFVDDHNIPNAFQRQLRKSKVETRDGRPLFSAAHKLLEILVEKLINYHLFQRIRQLIQLSVPMEK